MADSRSTAPPDVSVVRLRRVRILRRMFFGAICVLLIAAALGRLGVHSKTVTATGGGYELSVTYDDVTRGGLPSNMTIEIRRTDGSPFPATIDVAIGSTYGDMFDQNAVDPTPVETFTTEERLVQRFRTPPSGDTTTVGIDARVQPGVQWRRVKGEVAILDAAGQDVVALRFSTFVMP